MRLGADACVHAHSIASWTVFGVAVMEDRRGCGSVVPATRRSKSVSIRWEGQCGQMDYSQVERMHGFSLLVVSWRRTRIGGSPIVWVIRKTKLTASTAASNGAFVVPSGRLQQCVQQCNTLVSWGLFEIGLDHR